ncbi:MAG TPA: nucleotidyl transferase AbiEii/AbiGii toxin family protein [Paludibacter sp.]|nr:nucleotidyl transferase AbiEii/AbiGii toxin family protein [Paludibacter sp.]
MPSLAPHTEKIFDQITLLECIKDYTLVGGTALSLQINNRLSEDLDFMKWKTTKNQKEHVDWVTIEKEIKKTGEIQSFEMYDFNHVQFVVNGVKLSFYISDKYSPVKVPVYYRNNLKLADLMAITAMKMEVMLRRSNFRDYYDIYSLLQHGINFRAAVELSLNYSNHVLSTKNLLAILSDGSRFSIDSTFLQLEPTYNVSVFEIENYIKQCIVKEFK